MVVRKAKKIGLSGAFRDDEHARKCIRCLTCLPLLPADDISNAVTDLEALVSVSNETNKPLLRRLLQYSAQLVVESYHRTSTPVCQRQYSTNNNGVESFHAGFRRLVKISHPSFYGFVEYLQEVTLSNMADVQRLNTSRRIRRAKKKSNVMNGKRIRDSIARYSAGGYSAVEFLSSVCHCCESVTYVLNQDNDGSSTEEYELSDEEDH